MTVDEAIRMAVQRLAADPLPLRIILFGSQARGDADPGSDIDLLVVESEVPNRGAEMVRLQRLLRSLRAPFAVVVLTQQELDRWGREPGSLAYWVLQEGKVIHVREACRADASRRDGG